MRLARSLRRFLSDEGGQGIAEYGLILVLMSAVVIATIQALSHEEEMFYIRVVAELTDSMSTVS